MSFDRMNQMDWTYGQGMTQAQRGTIVGQVMGLLAFSLLFTAGGYLVGRALGPAGMIIGIVGALATVLALSFARTKMSSGVALGVFYLFSVFEGMTLGLIIDSYLARGMGMVVVNAATTTAGLVLVLSAYAWTTKRDLSGMGAYLMAGLLAVLLAGLVMMVLSLFGVPMGIFGFLLSVVTAVLFSGFVMYDMQRLKNAQAGLDDPIMLAVGIYLSIFNLFLAILRIFGFLSSSDE
ncbi:MAG TPA: Bax inhibitor-1/YccA family protein [Chloroflexota bacterium]|nr:Bax inhibitor-1/YccA family protein [Chloroflexota bacterium]